MGIKDRDVRDALSTLETEFENMEASLTYKEEELQEAYQLIDNLKEQVEAYETRITELEEALAEAYLTSEPDSNGIQREDVELPPGSGSYVPDPAGD